MVNAFDRNLPDEGLKLLERQPDWWRDLLAYRYDANGVKQPLLLAIRDGYMNAYVEGQSVLKIEFNGTGKSLRLAAKIHQKYVFSVYPDFDGKSIDGVTYESGKTLKKWADKAQKFVHRNENIQNTEKQGVAAIAQRNSHVIDLEMGLPVNAVGPNEEKPKLLKMDIVAIEKDCDALRIVFYEAKLFRNKELRAANRNPQVLTQLKLYEDWFDAPPRREEVDAPSRREQVVDAYRRACDLLIRINAMWSEDARRQRPVHPFIEQAAKKDSNLIVDTKPRLIIYGYEEKERDRPSWQPHECVLRNAGIRLIMVPRPEDLDLPESAICNP